MGTEQKNLDVPFKVTGKTVYGIDVRLPGMKWAAVKACPVYGGDVKSYDFEAIRKSARRALRRAVPDSGSRADSRPRLQRRRRRHRRHAGTRPRPRSIGCRSSGRFPPRTPRSTRRTCDAVAAGGARSARHACASIRAMSTRPSRAPPRSSKRRTRRRICRAHAWSPATPRCSSTSDRVDIWIGDQSPQETRFSAAKITGIPEQNVHLHLCHLGGGFGRNGNGPQAEHAIMIANANRGMPIHLLWTREEDFIGTTYRAMGVARLQGRPRRRRLADRARGAHRDAGRRVRPRRIVRRDLALPRAELSLLEPHDEVPRSRRHAARHRPGGARVLSRELHGRARARGRQRSVSLSARAPRPHQLSPTRTT